ncbi:protein kinase [Nonomuraea sp. PA05]|uniref:serine/threonine-protein kinase n=1 Tax=Nonomuraea sp. PA05 TaxID=2604466 RepID=UPI0011D7A3C3|nr:serine/threonine-protein kinase [Nonomuraea sp. PA05]TYB54329.1 protein kinase [Nonomuraea sp. PA05]
MPEPMSLLPDDPAEVGPYRLEGRLGAGGQGTVYTARGPGGPLVAVKLLHSHLITDDEARNRFLREVQTAERVAPFCTVQLLDSGFLGARPYIVSEYVDGPSLQDSVRESGPRGAAALQRLAINTATALAAIHAAGVVHRDFKPGNVLLGPDGPVVIDFGIAKALDVSQSVVSSQPIGSPAYMAPEQIADEDVGPAADLFAWAATMYYAATGQRAFPGESIPATLNSVLRSEPDLSGVEGRLRLLLAECLDKEQAGRPTAAQVVERLRALSWQDVPADGRDQPAHAGGVPTGYAAGGHLPTAPHTRPGRRVPAIVAAGAALVLAAGVGISVYALTPATAQRQAALRPPPSTSPPASAPVSTPSPAPTAYELLVTKKPGKTAGPAPASPTKTPRRSATPARDSDAMPGSSATTATKKPRKTPEPTRKPSATSQPPSPKPSLQPSTGTVTWNDVGEYCKAHGQTLMYGAGWSGMKCSDGAEVSVTAVCAWKYPAYGQAVGVPPENPFMPSATCNLS